MKEKREQLFKNFKLVYGGDLDPILYYIVLKHQQAKHLDKYEIVKVEKCLRANVGHDIRQKLIEFEEEEVRSQIMNELKASLKEELNEPVVSNDDRVKRTRKPAKKTKPKSRNPKGTGSNKKSSGEPS